MIRDETLRSISVVYHSLLSGIEPCGGMSRVSPIDDDDGVWPDVDAVRIAYEDVLHGETIVIEELIDMISSSFIKISPEWREFITFEFQALEEILIAEHYFG